MAVKIITQGNATGEHGSFRCDIFDPLNQTSDTHKLYME